MRREKLSVPEVHCDHCKSSIEGAVGALPGVVRVEVDIEGRSVDVDYRDDDVERRAIIDAIEEQGYVVAD